MNHINLQYRCLLLFLIIKINLNSGQICQNNDIPDFFYNVDFTGPIFDQPVYTILSNFSISTPINTTVFKFNVKPQTIYTRPSFNSIVVNDRALNITTEDITVTSSDPSFIVGKSNDSYILITNTSPLNYFLLFNRYLFKLIAKQTFSDRRRPPVTSTAIVQINLKNDNVHSPVFILDNQIFYISETAESNTQFGTVYATDADNDAIEYSISASGQFSIDPSTGVLRLERKFDSSLSEYLVDVIATDDSSSCSSSCPKRSNSTKIRIILTAVNKNSPQFTQQTCGKDVSLNENNRIGEDVVSLVVLDNDRGENGLIYISFPSEQSRTTASGLRNTAYSQFYIEQLEQTNTTRTAILRTNETFDYDKPGATRVWYLFILATDNGKPQRQAFCSLRINLRDVNDNAPVFIMTSWNYTIYRSSINSSNPRFLRIIASDADSGSNGMINYYIGTPNLPYFSINRTTGAIILRSDVSDMSNLNITRFPITFYVYAQDRGAPPLMSKNNATVTIYYSNSDDPVPARWLDTSYEELNISISEKFYELYPNRTIFDDNNGFNGSIFYELTSQSSSIMTVNSPFFYNTDLPFRDIRIQKDGRIFNSGIAVTSGLHAEIQNVYLLYIRVLTNPPLIGSVTIRLKDENDQIPTFDIRSIVLSVMEKENSNRTIAQIQAFDRDIDYENNHVEYALNKDLSDIETIDNFHVGSDGTIWTNSIFGGENNKTLYRLFITAFNEKPAWNSASMYTQDFQFDVQVISINDKQPVFNNGSLMESISINETTVIGTDILRLTIVDMDIDTNLNLGILNGNLRNAFTFTLLSTNSDDSTRTQYEAIGQLKVVAPLDYELTSDYTLVLFAFDTKNLATINVTVHLEPQNTKAPYFDLMPGFTSYEYRVSEATSYSALDGHAIKAIDLDANSSQSLLHYEIYDTRHQLDLTNLFLNKTTNHVRIGIKSPGLSRDLPFGDSIYNFSIRVTDENGSGVSSYVPVTITITDINNKAPIPTKFPCIKEGINSKIPILFEDYDDPTEDNTIPYRIEIVNSPSFSLIGPTVNFNGSYELVYNGILNRTLTKNLTVTFNASDNKGFSEFTTISIIVCDQLNTYPISDGSKIIKVIYVNGYQNSLRNVELGSIYVKDLNDWFRINRTYSIRDVSNGQIFNVLQGLLSTSQALYPGSSTIHVDVTKSYAGTVSSALSTINLEVESVDSEYVRQASTIRIQGEYPETLIDPTLGYPLNKLRNALASVLSVNINSILILSIRSVFQYQSPYDRPKPFEIKKSETLTDVIFYALSSNKFEVERVLNTNLARFASQFQIKAVAIEPNPCNNYACPIDTTCRATRTIQPKPSAIDTNLTSFVGINILDSADCVNSTSPVSLTKDCTISPSNNLPYCLSTSLQSYGLLGPCCEVLGRTFDENGGGYATYAGITFSSFAPTRFSFDFTVRSPIRDSFILLYGRNSVPVNDFFWIAIEIRQSKLRFHFRNQIFDANDNQLNSSIWYHVECQFIDSTILISINDCQYIETVNNTLSTSDLSTVQLYLGGLPMSSSLVSVLYPTLGSVDNFSGCLRNVLSNGYYLDMSKSLSSANSNYGECPCSVTNSCITEKRVSDIIVPWYTWLIMTLVLLLLATMFAMILLTFVRKRQQVKILTGLYTDDTRENIIDYKETAGEEDHSTYDLRVLKKPIYALTDGNIISNNGRSGHNDPRIYLRPSLCDYIDEKLNEQIISYANDTQLRYQYEGEGSIASNLSSIESPPLSDEHDYRFFYSLGPKFSILADLYAGHVDDTNK